jgi:hypothetical protein
MGKKYIVDEEHITMLANNVRFATGKDEKLSVNEMNNLMLEKIQIKPKFVNSIEECVDKDKIYVLPDGCVYSCQEETVTVETGNNILPSLTPVGDLAKTESGLYYGVYASTSNNYGTDANCTITGVIPLKKEDCPVTFYMKGFSSWGSSSHDRIGIMASNAVLSTVAVNGDKASTLFDLE